MFGIVGFGKFGIRMVGIVKVFGMNVIVWSLNFMLEKCMIVGVGYVMKEEFFVKVDIVSIYVVLSE